MTPEQEQIAMLTQKVKEQAEIIDYLTRKLFGKKAEQIDPDQLSLLDEDDGVFTEPEQTGEENQTDQVQSTKKRKKTRKEVLSADLPVRKTIVDIETKQCPHGHCLVSVGTKFVRQELHFRPAQLFVEEVYAKTYKCEKCEVIDGLAKMIQAQAPKPLIPHSLGSASLITEIIHQKFEQGVPLYRQLKDWRRLGVNLTETTLSNWIIKTSELVKPLYNLIRKSLMTQDHLQGDETPIQVLREPGKKATSKSFMWVARSTQKALVQAVLYAYGDTRSGAFAQNLYRGFTGVLQCDGYAGYNYLEDSVVRVGCFAHVRRKFYDAANVNGKLKMSQPLKLLDEMFALERKWQHHSPRSRKRSRNRQLRKLLRKFWSWIDQADELPKSRLGKAIVYAQNQRVALNRILDHGELDFSNNAAERNMKSLVIGRKNWLFSTSQAGAEATAIWMTLIESAKANGNNPQDYIRYLLESMPQLPEFAKESELVAYLPWNFTGNSQLNTAAA